MTEDKKLSSQILTDKLLYDKEYNFEFLNNTNIKNLRGMIVEIVIEARSQNKKNNEIIRGYKKLIWKKKEG